MPVREDTVLKIISGENYTPCGLAEKLGARVVLESASYMKGKSRHSLLLIDEAFRLVQKDEEIFIENKNQGGSTVSLPEFRDILDAAGYFSKQHAALEFPFPAGGIGYLSYEFVKNCDKVKFRNRSAECSGDFVKADAADEKETVKISAASGAAETSGATETSGAEILSEIPDASLLFGHVFLIYDHYTDLIYLLGINYKEAVIDLAARIAGIEKRIKDLDFNYLVERDEKYECTVVYNPPAQEFMDNVVLIKEEIKKGNLLQCVVSRKLGIRTEMPPFRAYKKLKSASPSSYMFFLDFTDFQLFGSSPEVHLLVNEDKATMRPIAGTRRRGRDQEEDSALERELLEDEKEGCEHLMLVDLARNDLGRVCSAGSVKVSESRTIERYSHVMHIVSQVEGELGGGVTGADALRATFPAGTVSGAPKLKAIEIIDRLEREKRGFYAGIVGYFEPGGNLNSCINIRSGMMAGDILTLQSGAGIVADSVPEREYEETCEKMRAIAKVLGLEV